MPKVINPSEVSLDIKIFNDAVGQTYNGIPSLEVNQIHTKVIAQNKSTVVIGGIIKNMTTELRSEVPWIADIPWIGNLFKYKNDRIETWELTAFLTPVIYMENAL